MTEDSYVLRDRDRQELQRLQLQHEVWRESTKQVLGQSGFQTGGRILDLGCGPGYLSIDLGAMVGNGGRVEAVDASQLFVSYANQSFSERNLTHVRASLGDLKALDVGNNTWDGAMCRWVLMFISEPELVIDNVAKALRPGGTFVAMEYFQFKSMSLWPDGTHFKEIYSAVHTLITQSGGDPDIGGSLPELLVKAGLKIVDLIPILRVGRPDTRMWDWMASHNQNHTNLVEAGLLSDRQLQAYYTEFEEHSKNPAAFFTAPPILATIARKV